MLECMFGVRYCTIIWTYFYKTSSSKINIILLYLPAKTKSHDILFKIK